MARPAGPQGSAGGSGRLKRTAGAGLLVLAAAALALPATGAAYAQGLSDRAKARDANGNGVIDRDEAGGPLAANFDDIDCNRSGTLDGAEIRGFFTGQECPKTAAATAGAGAPAAAGSGGPPGDRALGDRAKARDANGNGVIDRDEAGGPLAANFDDIDCDRSGTLDGAEIRGFFTGQECPKTAAARAKAPAQAARTGGRSAGGRPPRPVRVDEVIAEPQSRTDPVLGRLVARRAGSVAALINGAVENMDVRVGDRVRKGDVIATLGRASLSAVREKFAAALGTRRAMLRTAEVELSKKDREYERMKGLRTSSSFSRARFEDLERDVQARRAVLAERRSLLSEAQADLKRVEIDLSNSEIRAPYGGVVAERHTEVGAYVGVGARVVTLINDRDIEIEAEIPSDRLAGLRPGVRIRFRLDDDTWGRASVRAVVPRENPRTRTRPVRFLPNFDDTVTRLAVNQSVTVLVPIGEVTEVITVHKDAVVHGGANRTVYLARRGKAFPRQVTLGDAIGNRYVVLSGLEPGDQVITHGNEGLPPGAAVQIVANRLAPAASERP